MSPEAAIVAVFVAVIGLAGWGVKRAIDMNTKATEDGRAEAKKELASLRTDQKADNEALRSDVRSVGAAVSSHETRLALVEQRAAHLEVEVVQVRSRQHDSDSVTAGLKMRLDMADRRKGESES